jgi:DNA-directed RNA polymerase specialized sigma24 family protein
MNSILTTSNRAGPTVTTDLELDDLELGEMSSFEAMYRREYPGLVGVARALSGRDAQDLVHDAMVKALVNWKRVSQYQRLDVPEGTVKSDLSRARAALQREMI